MGEENCLWLCTAHPNFYWAWNYGVESDLWLCATHPNFYWTGIIGAERAVGATSARPKTHVANALPYFFRRVGCATIFLFQPQTPKRGFGRGAGLAAGARRVPSTKIPEDAKGSRRRKNETESAPRSPNKKPRRMGGVLFAKESYYLVVMNTPGPMVELKETLFT